MVNIDDLEKLSQLKEKGIISQQEFDEQKARALGENAPITPIQQPVKSQVVYCVLALFLGHLGVHNFYIGRWKQGLGQLLLTLTCPFTIFFGVIVAYFWGVLNIFLVRTDGEKRPLNLCDPIKWILGIFGILSTIVLLCLLFFVILALGISEMEKAQADEILKYSENTAKYASIADEIKEKAVPCSEVNVEVPDVLAEVKCMVRSNGQVMLSDLDEDLKKRLREKAKDKIYRETDKNLYLKFEQ